MRAVERYALYDDIASGGMATVYLARLRGKVGFSRIVAVKALHAQYAKEEAFRAMFLDEARLVSRVRHPNVVPTIDVLEHAGELFLVMDYVQGESLSRLLAACAKRREAIPVPIVCSILIDALEGLHAAHEATSEDGKPLSIVHRDVSPQNILVGDNGVALVADFGVAKAVGRLSEKFSLHDSVKGKAGYMAPEQARGKTDRRADVYAAGVVLWEMLVGKKLFTGDSFLEIITKALDADVPPPSSLRADVPKALDEIVQRAIVHDVKKRFPTAREMAISIEKCGLRASPREVGDWVRHVARESLDRKAALIARIESGEAENDPSSEGRKSQGVTIAEGADPQTVLSLAGTAADTKTKRRSVANRAVLATVVGAAIGLGIYASTHAQRIPEATATQTPTADEPSIPPASASPVAANTESAAASTTPAPSSASIATTTVPKHRATHHAASTTSPKPAESNGACHWEQLPDEQGIMIPKKVCP